MTQRKEVLLAVCHTHDLSWDIDYDPPQCDCAYNLLVFECDDRLRCRHCNRLLMHDGRSWGHAIEGTWAWDGVACGDDQVASPPIGDPPDPNSLV